MSFKKLMGKWMFGTLDTDLRHFGEAVEQRLIDRLRAEPDDRYRSVKELKSKDGEPMGRLDVYSAKGLDRLACLSITILPGMRYFNVHGIPEPGTLAPRFNCEGMVTTRGSQVSMDLYPDFDTVESFDVIGDHYAGVARTWDLARAHARIRIEPSKLAHLRAFCSPYFLLASKVQQDDMPVMEQWALNYVDNWLEILAFAKALDESDTARHQGRRRLIAEKIIANDPDRHRVVEVFGESTTRAIEEALMPL